MGWLWHQLKHLQVIYILLQVNNNASTYLISQLLQAGSFCDAKHMNQQYQNIEGNLYSLPGLHAGQLCIMLILILYFLMVPLEICYLAPCGHGAIPRYPVISPLPNLSIF